jgi:acyl carrier protein
MTPDQVLADVRAMLIDIIGAEYASNLDIDMDATFEADLELESIEFVKLSGMLAEHYGNRIDLISFFAHKSLNEIIDMTVGEVVTYISGHLDTPTAVTVDA